MRKDTEPNKALSRISRWDKMDVYKAVNQLSWGET